MSDPRPLLQQLLRLRVRFVASRREARERIEVEYEAVVNELPEEVRPLYAGRVDGDVV